MAKRSPILGYNHNVRYRGLVFHVQTEDSGVLAPHLFTHLFHSGVIVSTRKYVYDAGSTEETIKSLMQAQHKAVMKELRRGLFDDKIDQYLGGTPGLLPRGRGGGEAGETDDATIPDRSRAAGTPAPEPTPEPTPTPVATPPPSASRAAGTLMPMPAMARTRTGDGEELATEDSTVIELGMPREMTLEEPAIGLRPTEPALDPFSMLSLSLEERVTAQMAAQPEMDESAEGPATYPGPGRRGETVPPLPPPPDGPAHLQTLRDELPGELPSDLSGESSQEILIQLEVDDSDEIPLPKPGEVVVGRRRRPHDTEAGGPWMEGAATLSDGIPGMGPGPATVRNPGDASGAVFSPTSGAVTGPISQRTAKAVGAASLPPARPITRPATRPAVMPPPGARPAQTEDRRTPNPDSNEVYAPADPAGQAPERPGQYSQHNKISSRIPTDVAPEGTRPVTPPQGLTPPQGRPGMVPQVPAPARPTAPTPPSAVPRVTPPPGATGRPAAATPPSAVPVTATGQSLSGAIPMPVSMTPSGAITVPAGHPLSGPIPVPASIPPSGPIPRPPTTGSTPPPSRTGTPSPAPLPQAARPPATTPVAPTPAVPRRSTPTPMAIPVVRPQGEPRSRTPTPQRVSMSPSAAGGLSPARSSTNSGVVMTRPAVIVGAPKPATATSRVRKAREDEGRGFGQGLISEKSLDEVILAYLSEDAEDK